MAQQLKFCSYGLLGIWLLAQRAPASNSRWCCKAACRPALATEGLLRHMHSGILQPAAVLGSQRCGEIFWWAW